MFNFTKEASKKIDGFVSRIPGLTDKNKKALKVSFGLLYIFKNLFDDPLFTETLAMDLSAEGVKHRNSFEDKKKNV